VSGQNRCKKPLLGRPEHRLPGAENPGNIKKILGGLKMKKYNCFWNNSSDMVDFYRALEGAIAGGIVSVDEDDNDGTAFNVACDFAYQFEQLARKHDIEIVF
jgi:hypothetical protein